jgi:SAM-dependent methyltransferase
MHIRIPKSEKRTLEQLREQYEVEKELANRLRTASREERRYLYSAIYDEFYQRVPHQSQVIRKKDSKAQLVMVSRLMRLLKRFINPEYIFLEVGPGDCSLSVEVAKHVRKVYAIDVSREITKDVIFPQNLELVISDGCNVPIAENSINVAYSNQLMEHLHPSDAFDQLQEIYKALTAGGIYICITPNWLTGPHDISKYFDRVSTGFHLKEYMLTELCVLFRKVGFSRISSYVGARGIYIKFPLFLVKLCEKLLIILPFSLRRSIANTLPFRILLSIKIVGEK